MSRKLLLSSIAIAATATMLGVGTFATFSDQETSAVQSVAAGTLDLKILNPTDSGSEYLAFAVTNAKPGDVSAVKMIHFRNDGSLPGQLYVKVVMDSNDENGVIEPEVGIDGTAGVGELGDNLFLSIDGISPMLNKSLTALNAAAPAWWDSGPLLAGHEGWVSVAWTIPSTVGNEIMSDSVTFHLEFSLEQM